MARNRGNMCGIGKSCVYPNIKQSIIFDITTTPMQTTKFFAGSTTTLPPPSSYSNIFENPNSFNISLSFSNLKATGMINIQNIMYNFAADFSTGVSIFDRNWNFKSKIEINSISSYCVITVDSYYSI